MFFPPLLKEHRLLFKTKKAFYLFICILFYFIVFYFGAHL